MNKKELKNNEKFKNKNSTKNCSNLISNHQHLISDHKAITLIALVITIIIMLILVSVTVTMALNGGLFNTTKEAAKGTQLDTDRESLLGAVLGSIGRKSKVDYDELEKNLPEGFVGNKEDGYTSDSGNTFYVDEYGNITTEKGEDKNEESTSKSISLDQTKVHLDKDETITLTATLVNLEEPVYWETTNSSVVSISEGNECSISITGENTGVAYITAHCGDYSAKCDVMVGEFAIPFMTTFSGKLPTGITFKGASVIMDTDLNVLGFYWSFDVPKSSIAQKWDVGEYNEVRHVYEKRVYFSATEQYADEISVTINNWTCNCCLKTWVDKTLESSKSSEWEKGLANRYKSEYEEYLSKLN